MTQTSPAPIVLLTDFGLVDSYVGVMKGVILSINPVARIVDLSHAIAPQDVAAGARMLAESYRYFPAEAIFVGVVDPDVGSARRGVALRTPRGRFVGPDNGLFSDVLDDLGLVLPRGGGRLASRHPSVEAVTLENPVYFLPQVSRTFHGRDIFAPVAAHLSLGVPLGALGPSTEDLVGLARPAVEIRPDEVRGRVVQIDRFGNAITDIRSRHLTGIRAPVVLAAGQRIIGISSHYAEQVGLLALIGSSDHLEIALNGGDAATALGLRREDPIVVRECSDGGESP